MKKAHELAEAKVIEEEVVKQKKVEDEKLEDEKFWKEVEESPDPTNNLTSLANYIEKNLKVTGVYIGKLEPKMKEIKDDDDENAHIDEEAPKVIKFKHANASHETIMIGKVLPPDQGLCHGLFGDGGDGEDAEEPAEAEGSEGEGEKEEGEKVKEDILKKCKHTYVK